MTWRSSRSTGRIQPVAMVFVAEAESTGAQGTADGDSARVTSWARSSLAAKARIARRLAGALIPFHFREAA